MATVDYLLFALKLFAALWADNRSLLYLLDLRDERPCLTVSGTGHCCHASLINIRGINPLLMAAFLGTPAPCFLLGN